MNYLIFDLETGDSQSGLGGICSFGYVLCNDNLEIIKSKDIIINPELLKWDWYALKKILPYDKEEYESKEPFNVAYKEIKKLFEIDDLYVVNHAIENDIRMIIQTCRRYKISFIDFKYLDSSELYKKIKNRKHIDSLDTISMEVCETEKRKKHSSLDDALRVHTILKKICENESLSLGELFKKYNILPKKYSDYDPYSTIDFNNNSLSNDSNKRLLRKMLKKTKVKKNTVHPYNGLSYLINVPYRMSHFRELLYIIKLAGNRGMTYSVNPDKCDIFVIEKNEKNSGLYKQITDKIEQGKNIKIMELDEFLNMINFASDRADNYFRKIIKRRPFLELINDDNNNQE